MPDDSQRLFSDEEISRILKRASAMQQESAPETSGLTLDELQQVAAEAGIDPRYVALAASEIVRSGGGEQPSFYVLGGPVSTLEERTIEGALTDTEREELLAEIRRTFRKAGTVSQVGRTLEWTHSERNDQTQVTITSRGGRTQLRLFQRFPKMTVLTFVLPLAVMLQVAINVPLIFGFPAVAGWLWALGLLAATFLVARFGYSRLVRRKERKARKLLNRLAKIATASGEAVPTPEAGVRLDVSGLEDEIPVAETPERSAARRKASS